MSHNEHCDHEHEHEEFPENAAVGQKVPFFTLTTFDPEEGFFGEFSLEKAVEDGKWTVLFFYPADFTFVCPTELADLAAKHAELKELGCEVVSVSTDTEFAHLAWRQSEKLLENVKFPMGSDPTGALADFFNIYDFESGLALRGTFIISPDGVLVASEVNYPNVGRDADELVRKIKANVYLRENPNEACPAKWNTGDKTLTPSEEIVGNVYDALK